MHLNGFFKVAGQVETKNKQQATVHFTVFPVKKVNQQSLINKDRVGI